MSDPERTPNLAAIAKTLHHGSTLIYRHFGASNKTEIATHLRQITLSRNIQFLIGKDVRLAEDVGADGVHLPEEDLEATAKIHNKHPNWLLSGAAHSRGALKMCSKLGLDAAIVSPVFASKSASASKPMGVAEFSKLAIEVNIPVFALGGINADNANLLLGTGAAGMAGVSGFTLPTKWPKAEPVELHNIDDMAALHNQAFDYPWPKEDFINHIENKHDIVLGISDIRKLMAFVIIRVVDGQAEILTLVVKTCKQKLGLASLLLLYGEREVLKQDADIVFLEVAKDNTAAIQLYKKCGYQHLSTRPRYYRREINGKTGRVDALLYKKHLA